ncbi:MAG: DHH family phosphoesterase [Halanaerobiales bacterium]
MESLMQVRDMIEKKDNFLLMGHVDPDGDCIGSLFALKWYLDFLNKHSLILLENSPSERYELFDIDPSDYLTFEEFSPDSNTDYTCLALDAGDMDRLGSGKELAEKYFLINIDHHLNNPEYGDINYVNSEKAAVGEIIYDLLELSNDFQINKKVGTAIVTAVIADTGGFRYQNTTARVFDIISEIMETGVDIYRINRSIFADYKFNSVKLKGMALSTLELHDNEKIAYLRVEQNMLKKVGLDIDDASGLVNYARDIRGVEVGLIFSELNENETRVGFRSNEYCPVNEIAAIFGGGGHARAAGCTIDKNIDKAQKMVLSKVEEYV